MLGCRERHPANRAGLALSGAQRGASSAARRGMATAFPQEASEVRSAGHGAKASDRGFPEHQLRFMSR